MRLGFVLFGLLNFNTPFTFGAELQERLTDSISVTASPYVHLGELSPLGKLSTSGQDIEAHHGQHGDVVQISSGQALTSIPGVSPAARF